MPAQLIVVVGPTGVGKTGYAVGLARQYQCPIISADSRQIYRGMAIGTDAPSAELQAEIPHYFIGSKEVWEDYSASDYAGDVLELLTELRPQYPRLVLVGGSMLYLQALLFGISRVPLPSPELRQSLWQRFHTDGVESLRNELEEVDPSYLAQIDPNNHKRIIRALEVYHATGHPFSSFHQQSTPRPLPYEVDLRLVTRPRAELYDRINARVEQMVERGLVAEVQRLAPYRSYNALNTIGYKEIFQYLDGTLSLEETTRLIAKRSRVYARQQLTYFGKWCREGSPFHYTIIDLGA